MFYGFFDQFSAAISSSKYKKMAWKNIDCTFFVGFILEVLILVPIGAGVFKRVEKEWKKKFGRRIR